MPLAVIQPVVQVKCLRILKKSQYSNVRALEGFLSCFLFFVSFFYYGWVCIFMLERSMQGHLETSSEHEELDVV